MRKASSGHLACRPGHGTGKSRRLPGVLELSGRLSNGKATQVVRYLPLGIPTQARDYVRHAVLGQGQIRPASRSGATCGSFLRSAQRRRVHIAGQGRMYGWLRLGASGAIPVWASPWPAFSSILAGELVFVAPRWQIQQAKARPGAGSLRSGAASATWPSIRLEIDGTARFHSLCERHAGGRVDRPRPGPGQCRRIGRAEAGVVAAAGKASSRARSTAPCCCRAAMCASAPDTPLLVGAARGRVEFTQQGVPSMRRCARFRRRGAGRKAVSQPDGSLRFTASGTASAEGLRRRGRAGHGRVGLRGPAGRRLTAWKADAAAGAIPRCWSPVR